MVVLAVARPEDIHAEGDLVLSTENIHVVGALEAGDRKAAERTRAAADREAAVVDRQLQEVLGALVDVLDAERRRINTVRTRPAVVPSAPDRKVKGVDGCRADGESFPEDETLRVLVIAGGGRHQ